MRKIIFFGVICVLLVLASIASAKETSVKRIIFKPYRQMIKAPGASPEFPVVSLGKAIDKKSGKLVDGFAIVHYAKDYKIFKPASRNTCYSFIAKGAKWKNIEPWLVNPENTRGLEGTFILNNFSQDIAKWEDAADGKVGDGRSINIIGDGSLIDEILVADEKAPDGKNEVLFGNIDSPGAIAVTIVWGIFGGWTPQRKLVEWDQVYDDVDFDWSTSGEPNEMDFENIATHELGHSVGMGDLYTSGCNQETMYGYADYGQTNKRDLNIGDITGINLLY